ncbi:MAG: amidase [Gammaproteobacteria bacterium]|nr:amidase [Gammaproteobacteria bacterium]
MRTARRPLQRCALVALLLLPGHVLASDFRIEESTIGDLHQAIRNGETTCLDIVRTYVERARAYNGICTALVTPDGAPIAPATGVERAGTPLRFPRQTVAVNSVLPDFERYHGKPIEYGRMEATASDPSVQQQYGMVTGIRDYAQVNALSTLNLRGERSVSCKAECDADPLEGELPAHCPSACEAFRRQPDAFERAAALDARYGRDPDLMALPMYCVVMSFKDVYDTTDMRSTGGGDVDYATDFAPRDSTVVAELRDKGAIIFAKANLSEYNGGSGDPGGDAEANTRSYGAGARSSWAGTACNPYDSARETGGSSSGSAVSVGANLVTCSICEETGGSCRQPAWRSGVVGLVTTKGLIGYGGAIGADPYLDRAGIHCRTVDDTARVLDALKDPDHGYFDSRDIYTALPPPLIAEQPYASFVYPSGDKPLAGMRIGIVREYMVKHAANDVAVSDRINSEIKRVLRDQLGAELVESYDPMFADDPSIQNMQFNFQDAIAEILPSHMPEFLLQTDKDGKLKFGVEGIDISQRDYMVALAEGKAKLPPALNLRSINSKGRSSSFSFHMQQYLMRRDDARIKNWAALNAHAKSYTDARRAAMENWANTLDIRGEGIGNSIKMREVMRLAVLKVMYENDLDVLVNPTITLPPALIGFASQPTVNDRPGGRFPTSANLGIPEITVPAGFNDVIYEPYYVLNEDRDDYVRKANEDRPSRMQHSMPFGISFWAGPGEEPVLFEVASAYESATHHRKPPPALGPVTPRH